MYRPASEETNAGVAGGELTHVDSAGRALMVDVTGKPWTQRRARARCRVEFGDTAIAPFGCGVGASSFSTETTWSELLSTARLAGIQAAKQTARLIPLCHPLTVSDVDVHLSLAQGRIEIEGSAEVTAPTGVEMEALTACAVAALTIVTALLPMDLDVTIQDLGLWEKSGGRSGTWVRN
jgi:cyclic pyranopterin phosphate synthase